MRDMWQNMRCEYVCSCSFVMEENLECPSDFPLTGLPTTASPHPSRLEIHTKLFLESYAVVIMFIHITKLLFVKIRVILCLLLQTEPRKILFSSPMPMLGHIISTFILKVIVTSDEISIVQIILFK